MAQRSSATSVENRIRSRRQAAGLSQQALAQRCGLTRQAVNAIEAGHYIPSTLVALRFSIALGCRVEELFRLTGERRRVEAEWLGEPSTGDVARTRIQLARVGDRLFARPLTAAAAFTAADGLTMPVERAPRSKKVTHPWVTIDLWVDAELPDRTVVVLGCDPALALLGAHLTRRYPAFRLIWVHSSSLTALRLLRRGEAHAAGTHLWDQESGEYNVPYVRRELSGRRLVIVTLSEWQQGLIVARGNPKKISGPADLARSDISMVNREPGAGSRTLLDLWLQGAGVTAMQVNGYSRVVSSHLEVAETVARGLADVGPGIMAVAQALGLDFLPVQEERYDLVIPLEFLNAPAVQALLDIAVSRPFQEELEALGGYDSSRAGTVVAELAS
ncbi:MAG: substrate-binding domain-containing protein [Candidatus Entotheonellia bacterium]